MRGGVVGPRVSRGGHLSEGEEDRGRGDACVQPCVFARSRVSARLDQPAPRGFSRRRRARAHFLAQRRARETARGRPHLRISLVLRRSRRWFPPRRVSSRARRRGVGVRIRARRERVVPRRRPTSTSAPASIGDVRDVHRELRRRSTVPPSCASPRRRASFPRAGAALAPHARHWDGSAIFFLSRSRAPIERLPALTHPRPLSPPQRRGGVPPSDKDACDPFGVRARRAPSSLSRRLPRAVVRSEEVLSFFRLLLRRRAAGPRRASPLPSLPKPSPRSRTAFPRHPGWARRFWCSTAARVLRRRRTTASWRARTR